MLEPGMLFTIEPMINLGKPHVKVLPDGWTAVTRDRELSAQFEHTVGVTEDGLRDFHVVARRLELPALQDRLVCRSRIAIRGGCICGCWAGCRKPRAWNAA